MNRFMQRTIGKPNKGFLLDQLIQFARVFARQGLFTGRVARMVARNVTGERTSKDKGIIRILVLNQERYEPDLSELAKHDHIRLLILPSNIQSLVNSLWLSPLRRMKEVDSYAFHLNRLPAIRKCRQALEDYLASFLPKLQHLVGFDCIITCSFFYKQDLDWASACKRVQIPFIALHKENMQDPVIQQQSIKRYQEKNLKFFGHSMIVFNRLAKSTLVRAHVAPEQDIHVAGALRIDTLINNLDNLPAPRKQITLFSFHHCIGLLHLENTENFFSNDPQQGFYEYFDLVHGYVAKFARDNPDVDVWIKPKWMGNWEDRIYLAIERAGINGRELPNLHVSVEKDAQTLIAESAIVLGLNSTTLLEAKLMKRHVIVPLFAEASGKYYDNHVYFKKYLDDAFEIVRTPEELSPAISEALASGRETSPLPQQMIEDFLGYADGTVHDRVYQTLTNEIQKVQKGGR